jgi:TRAP transporter TAXI family solute receptor
VFISHTSEFGDFPEGRSFVAAAMDAVRDAGDEPVEMGDFPVGTPPPAQVCREKIGTCDAYVALVGFRHGSTLPGLRGKSYVEFEWDVASKRGLPILVFLLDEKAVVPYDSFHGRRFHRRQTRLRAQMEGKHHLRRFRTEQELHKLLSEALGDLPGNPTPKPPAPIARRRRNRAAAVAAAAVLLVAGTTVAVAASRPGGPPQLGECGQIDISTALAGGSYDRYGHALGDLIRRDFPGSAVVVESTAGSAANLDRLGDSGAARCRLAIAQLNVAVDARYGVYQFAGNPNARLRMAGPLGYDILQLVVRADSPVAGAAGLCGKTVATPPQGSGSEQLAAVLFRQVEEQAPGCRVRRIPRYVPDAVGDLRFGKLDAVMFASGAANRETRDAHTSGTPIRLIPLDGFLGALQDDWDDFYGSLLGSAFVPGDIFHGETIGPADYPGLAPTPTVAVPNGVVVDEAADPDLVRFVADKLVNDRPSFARALWDGNEAARPFPGAREMLTGSSPYCMVPLHPGAAAYYQPLGIQPQCSEQR